MTQLFIGFTESGGVIPIRRARNSKHGPAEGILRPDRKEYVVSRVRVSCDVIYRYKNRNF